MMAEEKKKVFTPEQAHRILEDYETLVLMHRLQGQLLENFGRDYRGIMDGNNKEKIDNGQAV